MKKRSSLILILLILTILSSVCYAREVPNVLTDKGKGSIELDNFKAEISKFEAKSNERLSLNLNTNNKVSDICFEFPVSLDKILIKEIKVNNILWFDEDLKTKESKESNRICYKKLDIKTSDINFMVEYKGYGKIKYNITFDDIVLDPFLSGVLQASNSLIAYLPFDNSLNNVFSSKSQFINNSDLTLVETYSAGGYGGLCTDSYWSSTANLIDANYGSSASCSFTFPTYNSGLCYLYEIYTKSVNATGAVWQVYTTSTGLVNFTLPNECFNWNTTHISLGVEIASGSGLCGAGKLFCNYYTGAVETRYTVASLITNDNFYEDGVYFTNQTNFTGYYQQNVSVYLYSDGIQNNSLARYAPNYKGVTNKSINLTRTQEIYLENITNMPTGTQARSICYWLNPTDLSNINTIINVRNTSTSYSYLHQIDASNFIIKDNSTQYNISINNLTNTWHHFCEITSNTSSKFYLDNSLNYTLPSILSLPQRYNNFTIGNAYEGLNTNLNIYLKLEDTNVTVGTSITDSTGHTSPIITTTSPNIVTGIIGNAFNFSDRNGSYINAQNNVYGNITGNLSFSLWLKPKNCTVGGPVQYYNRIFGKSNGLLPASDSYWLEMDDSCNLTFAIRTSAAYHYQKVNSTQIVPGVWSHVVGVYTNATSFKFYINGSEVNVTQDIPALPIQDVTSNLMVGRGLSGANYIAWNGAIDEFMLWNRTLTSSEVSTLYNDGDGYRLIISHNTANYPGYSGKMDEFMIFNYALGESDISYLFYLGTNDTNVYNISLIDERTNEPFNLNYVTDAVIYNDDNSSYLNLKTEGVSNVLFYAPNHNNKVRLELIYESGVTITRYIDLTLLNESEEIRICANKNGTTHYEQIILSSSIRPVYLKSVYANCYVAADNTRFTYQENNILKAYTINTQYYLYVTDSNGDKIYLSGLDGSIASYYNIDNLEFNQKEYTIDVSGNGLSIYNNESMVILSYLNEFRDSESTRIQITRMNTSTLIFDSTETDSPNNFTIFYDYGLLNISDTELFKIYLVTTDEDGNVKESTMYFNKKGNQGWLDSKIAFTIALFLSLFGLTLVSTRYALGWFGVIIQVFSIIILTLCVPTWYTLFLTGIDVIVLIYCAILGLSINVQTTT